MTAGSLRVDAEQLSALQHLEPSPQGSLTCPAARAIDRHLAGAREEPLLSPALEASPGEVVGLGNKGDPPVHCKWGEQPVGEGKVVAGNERCTLGRHVLDTLVNRPEDLADHGPEHDVL